MWLPAVSSDECVRVLSRLGFERAPSVVDRIDGAVPMQRGWRAVLVPLADVLDEGTVDGILKAAGVSQLEFLDVLEVVSLRRMPAAARIGGRGREAPDTIEPPPESSRPPSH